MPQGEQTPSWGRPLAPPPGHPRLSTMPAPTGSATTGNTMARCGSPAATPPPPRRHWPGSAEGGKLRAAAGRAAASILIGVDQAEEIARADGSSGEALADYLRAALAATESSWQLTVARVKRHSRQVDKVDN